ncbi:MAG: radical SAM family heme chaperone HemW [Acidobacteriota bacterium]
MSSESFGIYVHIPFCVRKCPYCDFVSAAGGSAERASYLNALEKEIRSSQWKGCSARTIYFGGGTPSELGPPDLRRIMEALREAFKVSPEPECSIECNPGTLSRRKLAAMRSLGFNRLSLGVQSFSDRFLRALGRIHTSGEALEAWRLIRSESFGNVNLDLIFGIPGQTLENWREDLRQALELRPEHLSLYDLTIEPETEFGRLKRQGRLPEVDEELAASMYETAADLTAAAGYGHYEISNFALPGRECRHNLVYWRNQEYLGFGVSAASYAAGVRSVNVKATAEYVRAVHQGKATTGYKERLEPRAALGEEIMLRLRLAEGLAASDLAAKYNLDPEILYAETMKHFISEGLLTRQNGSIRLTARGRLLANEVCRRFL